jgi:hypothetical protein
MVNVKDKKCIKCDKIPNYNYPGEKTGLYCLVCKLYGMVDVKNKKCIKCDKQIHSYTKYDSYCALCFGLKHPKDKRTLLIKKDNKELKVLIVILNKYGIDLCFIHNQPFSCDLYGGLCRTKRRIDLRTLINNTMLCIEIDENQHQQQKYSKTDEDRRYRELFMDFSGKYIFIRYNPDTYKDKNKKQNDPTFETRMEELLKLIDIQIERIKNSDNIEFLEVHYLYYDEGYASDPETVKIKDESNKFFKETYEEELNAFLWN